MNLPSTAAPRRQGMRRRVGALTMSAIVLASAGVIGAVSSANAASTAPLDVLLGVGSTESQRILSWYYPSGAPQAVELEKTSDLTSGAFNTNKKVISATTAANTTTDTGATPQTGYYNAHASLLNLAPNTTYSYHVGATDGTGWSPIYTFKTQSFTGDFDFLFFGDPQIGSSGDTVQDGAGWAATLNYATTRTPNAELLVSGGDQVESANNETQWTAFADSNPTVLKQYPWAATIGNHDVGGKAYEQHNKLPNLSTDADYYPGQNTATNSGGDYYYIYKGVLFIDLNSNAYNNGSDAAHVAYVRSVVEAVGDKAKWKVLVYHHSIYSPADHANDADNQQRRTDFTTTFSDLGINLVLQGHDHSYSRSYAILNGAKANADEQPAQDEVVEGPGGVIYVTANSASGSKYYDLTEPDATKGGYGADPLDTSTGHKRHFANSVENQEHVRTYVQVSVTGDKLNVQDIRAGDCATPNSAVVNNAGAKCGVGLPAKADGAAAATAAVGSTVDKFKLDKVAPATTIATTASISSKQVDSTTPVTLTATVTGGLGNVSGTVSFYDGDALLGSSPLNGGKATYTVTQPLNVGTHSYTAKFATASAFTGTNSSSNVTSVTITAVPTPPVQTPPPASAVASITTLTVAKGVATVAVSAPGAVATGPATIFDGTTAIATANVVNGTGSVKVALATSGTHSLHAVFAATSTVNASTSVPVAVTIAKSTTSVKYVKKSVSVTVKASGISSSKVTGTAKVYDGKKVVKTVKIVKGKASAKLSLKKGTHKLHAVFALTDTVAASTSKTVSVKIK